MRFRYSLPILSYRETRELDYYTQDVFQFTGTELMGFAAKSFSAVYSEEFNQASRIYILTGKGNNGGDGYALAYFLLCEYKNVSVIEWTSKPKTDSAEFYREQYSNLEGKIESFDQWIVMVEKYSQPTSRDNVVVVDCVLGTGAHFDWNEDLKNWENSLLCFQSRHPDSILLALDHKTFPNLSYDSLGEIGCFKEENLGVPLSDKREIPIGFPISVFLKDKKYDKKSKYIYLSQKTNESYKNPFSKAPNDHKYSAGSAAFIGGENGMEGGLYLAISAFMGLGGGIAKAWFFSEEAKTLFLPTNPSLMVERVNELGILQDSFFFKTSVVLLGPGTSPEKDYGMILRNLYDWSRKNRGKVILDAGAISTYSQWNSFIESIPDPSLLKDWILTPHLGEFRKIIGKDIPDDPREILFHSQWFQKQYSCNLLVKTSRLFYTNHLGDSFILEEPNPRLATMGTGDLLGGILALSLSKQPFGSGIDSSEFCMDEAVFLGLEIFFQSRWMDEKSPTATEILKYLKGIG